MVTNGFQKTFLELSSSTEFRIPPNFGSVKCLLCKSRCALTNAFFKIGFYNFSSFPEREIANCGNILNQKAQSLET